MPHGKICYLEIPALTGEASGKFYSEIFGWKIRARGDGNIAFDDTAGVSGTWVNEGDRTSDETTRVYIMVDNINDTLKKIEAAGGRTTHQRTDIGPGMGAFAVFADPAGAEFGLYEEPAQR
jgi:predicted enzyme related to lactoylglutathione lyase